MQPTQKKRTASNSYATPMHANLSESQHHPARTVALNLENSYHQRSKQRVIARATELNWRIIDLKYQNNELPAGLIPDGALTEALYDAPLAKRLLGLRVHTVRLGRFPHPKDSLYPAVVPNMATIGELAAEHFAERGFRHIGFICYHLNVSHFKHLYDPFVDRAIELGSTPHRLELHPLPRNKQTLPRAQKLAIRDKQFAAWLKEVPKPIGILGFGDAMSARLSATCLNLGYSIPGEIAIVSCGNDPMVCECAPIRLSGIDTSGADEGDAAVNLLRDLMDGGSQPKAPVRVSPGNVTVRESSDVLATTDPQIAEAVRFMWSHLRENISVDDVAAAISVPRRTLERNFKLQIGRGVNAELLRRRLEYCCDLLRSTDLTVVDIVALVGFRSTSYLHRVFLRTFNMPPLQYRTTHSQQDG